MIIRLPIAQITSYMDIDFLTLDYLNGQSEIQMGE